MPASRYLDPIAAKVRGQRWRVARWRLRTERSLLAHAAKRRSRSCGRVLSYHSTGTPEWGVNDVAPGRFRAQLDLALDLGYRFVPIAHIVDGSSGPLDLAITFDDGLRSILNVVPYLREHEMPFAVFPVIEWTADPGDRFLSWNDLERLAADGATLGSHSLSHANFRELPPERRRQELEDSRAAIDRHLGVTPRVFAIPFGRRRDWDGESSLLARAAGYEVVLAQSEERRPAGTLARSFVARYDGPAEFRGMLEGRLDGWEEWF